jgi:hypothetical protein
MNSKHGPEGLALTCLNVSRKHDPSAVIRDKSDAQNSPSKNVRFNPHHDRWTFVSRSSHTISIKNYMLKYRESETIFRFNSGYKLRLGHRESRFSKMNSCDLIQRPLSLNVP